MRAWKWIRLSVTTRIAVSLVLLSTFTLTIVHLLEILPDPEELQMHRKTSLCEALSISCSLLAQRQDHRALEENLRAVVERNPDILTACLRRADGQVLEQIGEHDRHWHLEAGARSTHENIYVPITSQGRDWGTLEFSFARPRGLLPTMRQYPMLSLAVFAACLNGLIFLWYIKRVLTYLDPSKAVPMHVRSTLDTFAEGVVVLDDQQRIVLANAAFTEQVGKSVLELQGKAVDTLPWNYTEPEETPPWQADVTQDDSRPRSGVKLALRLNEQNERTFLVNTSAILAEDRRQRGTIASFDDITLMEQKKQELSRMLVKLQESRDALTQRNKELEYLATRDALTGCLNRRTFFEHFDKLWNSAQRYQRNLSCCMVDVDHFKSVNDNHGHSVGDEVLRHVAKAISDTARGADIVCRFGGEEFCVLLPESDLRQAAEAAERIRETIAALRIGSLTVTASLGVSAVGLGAGDPQELLDQADRCLYVAKRGGRNQVARWDDVPSDFELNESSLREAAGIGTDALGIAETVPYPAVASLLSALAYRDSSTAAHSTRVAELAVATARGLMSLKECYILEIAALLHDIGKIGVPDAILLKPGPLTPEEWATMRVHDRIGVEIVEASFSSHQLVDIVRYHHAFYGGNPEAPHAPRGGDIPLGARILSIADAFDAMVSDRVYRKGRSPEIAFEELRRWAGRQFDPDLVERFIDIAKDFKSTQLVVDSKQAALQIGLQIERLAQAVDERDQQGIKALAARLESTASRCHIPEIERAAAEIKGSAGDDGEQVHVLETVNQLIDLCRSTQKVYVDIPLREPVAVASEELVGAI